MFRNAATNPNKERYAVNYLGNTYTAQQSRFGGFYVEIDGRLVACDPDDPFKLKEKVAAELKEKWDKLEQDFQKDFAKYDQELTLAQKARKYALQMWYAGKRTLHKNEALRAEIMQDNDDVSQLSSSDQEKVEECDKEIKSSKKLISKSDTDFAIAGRQADDANRMRHNAAINQTTAKHSRPQIYV